MSLYHVPTRLPCLYTLPLPDWHNGSTPCHYQTGMMSLYHVPTRLPSLYTLSLPDWHDVYTLPLPDWNDVYSLPLPDWHDVSIPCSYQTAMSLYLATNRLA
ncbi:hypothetical protein ACJMK2_044312 [Sinanodonta woodiana]|uniref:Uncharacterized protein n=1 Tax=Sinanodonta woodiana TaxID=1069815 RepID=A0ABD3VZM4_SINWO